MSSTITTTMTATTTTKTKTSTDKMGEWFVGEMLGEGAYSKVRLGIHEKSGEKVALKILKPEKIDHQKVAREIDTMKKISHPNVISLKHVDFNLMYKAKKIFLFVLEFAPGGEIMDYIAMTGVFEEPLGRTYFHQLMEGISAAHKAGICHRDIKPENLLLDGNFQLKIADFGLARSMGGSSLSTTCGSPGYMAPEMHDGAYEGTAADVWACGVVLFIMIAGYPPYQELTDGWFKLLTQKNYSKFWAAHNQYGPLSQDLQDLITDILNTDPEERISIPDIKKHPWYQGETMDESEVEKAGQNRFKVIEKNKKYAVPDSMDDDGMDDDGGGSMVRELGCTALSSIVLVMKPGDEKDDDEEDNDFEVDIGSFDGVCDDLKDLDVVCDTTGESKDLAPLYAPIKRVFTKFDCSDSAANVLEGLRDVLSALTVKFTVENYTITGSIVSMKGEVNFVAGIFSHPEDPDLSIVEFQRRKGESGSYRLLYVKIRNKMDPFATKRGEDPGTDPFATKS